MPSVETRQTCVPSGRYGGGLYRSLRDLGNMERRRPRNPPARPLVLVIEGHEDTRALYALALSADGFDVVALEDENEASTRAWEIHPDIIVTDLPMPTFDG